MYAVQVMEAVKRNETKTKYTAPMMHAWFRAHVPHLAGWMDDGHGDANMFVSLRQCRSPHLTSLTSPIQSNPILLCWVGVLYIASPISHELIYTLHCTGVAMFISTPLTSSC